jgi:hypothetical protein
MKNIRIRKKTPIIFYIKHTLKTKKVQRVLVLSCYSVCHEAALPAANVFSINRMKKLRLKTMFVPRTSSSRVPRLCISINSSRKNTFIIIIIIIGERERDKSHIYINNQTLVSERKGVFGHTKNNTHRSTLSSFFFPSTHLRSFV